MSKKKKNKKVTNKTDQVSNIKKITCVDCPKETAIIVKQEECKACEYYSNGYCKYVLPAQPVVIVSSGTPMKYNRSIFNSMSTEIADTTRNYYLFTDIMQPVRNIKGYPNYWRIRARFLSGGFKSCNEKLDGKIVPVISNPVMHLIESDATEEPALILEGKKYIISNDVNHEGGNGGWEVLCYLYDTYSLDGFADIKLKDRWYKVRVSPIESSKEDYVLARKGKQLIIGRI